MVNNSTGEPAHAGSWKAWMDGYGTTHTDTLSQAVSIPAGCTATLSFFLHIDTAETTTTTAYDTLTVKAGSTVLATYSNLNNNTGFAQKCFTSPPSRHHQHLFHRRRGLHPADLVRARRHHRHRELIPSALQRRSAT